MSPVAAAAFSLAAFAGLGGASILVFRERVLRFVRERFQKVHREDGLTEADSDRRLPRMWIVVLIGLGWLVVAAVGAVAGWRTGALPAGATAFLACNWF